ncbi:MAG: TolC family protein [Parachlamydiales bacterium]|nr:TolC family protein [Parachlamydiales bacterium]
MYRLLILLFLSFSLSSCSLKKQAYQEVKSEQEISFKNWQSNYQQVNEYEKDLTLKKAIQFAFQYNKELNANLQKKDFAKGKILESFSHFLPKISAVGAYTYLEDHTKIGPSNERIPVSKHDNSSLTFQAIQPIFHAGSIRSGYKASKYLSFITDEAINLQFQKLFFDVSKSYFDVLLAEKLLLVQTQAYETAQKHFEEVKHKKEQGLASEYDLLRAEVNVTNFEAEKIKQKNKIAVFRTILLKLMGLSQDYEFDMTSGLVYDSYDIDVEKAVEIAYLNRPDIKMKSFDVKMQDQIVNIAKSDFYPKVNSFFAHRWGTEASNITTPDKWARDWNVRIQLDWSLFDFGLKRGKLKQQKASLKEKKYFLSDAKQSVVLEVQQAIFNLNDAKEFVKSQKLDLDRAQKALDLAQVGYNEGLKTETDVADALTSLTRSQSLFYQSLYQYNLAKISLKLAMGVVLEDFSL